MSRRDRSYNSRTMHSETEVNSPAGAVEQFGAFSRGLGRRRWGRAVTWVGLGLVVGTPLIAWGIAVVGGHH